MSTSAAVADQKTFFVDLRWASAFALRLLRRDKSEKPALLWDPKSQPVRVEIEGD